MPGTTNPPAFAGLKVIDLTQGLAGPYCAMLMAQNGANVVKVEPPEGDWARRIGLAIGERSTSYVACNRGKRAIVADLKTEDGLDVVRRLAAEADVFMKATVPASRNAWASAIRRCRRPIPS